MALQAAYVSSFGAGKPDTQTMSQLLKNAPLPHVDRQCWFRALASIPNIGPQIAHSVCCTHASMGSLVATYLASSG